MRRTNFIHPFLQQLAYSQKNTQKMNHNSAHIKFIASAIGLIFLMSLAWSYLEYQADETHWLAKLDAKHLTKAQDATLVTLQHDYGQQVPADLALTIYSKEGRALVEPFAQVNSTTLSHTINIATSQIKNVFVHSKSGLKILANGRLLEAIDGSPASFSSIATFISYFFGGCRNIIILAAVTNTIDLWLPLLMFIQCFLSLSLWTHNAHLFTTIFKNYYSSKVDVLNFVRLTFAGEATASNPYINAYGLSDKFINNCSGQLLLLGLLVVASGLIKCCNLLANSEKLRIIDSKLRPVWNGFLFWLCPRVLAMGGLALREVPTEVGFISIIHLIVPGVAIFLLLVFFVLLVTQIRRINAKLEYIQDSRHQIGLVSRIDYKRDFQFDCLEYSMLYYPAMNLGRIMFACMCIGFAPDFHYVQYGGIIAAYVFFMMIQVSSSGYNTARHRVMSPLLDFFFVIFLLCLTGVGLVYGVGHMELTIKLETICLSLLLFMLCAHLVQTAMDVVGACIQSLQKDSTNSSSKNIILPTASSLAKPRAVDLKKKMEKETIRNCEFSESQTEAFNTTNSSNHAKSTVKVQKVKKGKVY